LLSQARRTYGLLFIATLIAAGGCNEFGSSTADKIAVAIRNDDADEVARLAKDGVSLNKKNSRGESLLLLAYHSGSRKSYQALLDAGADPNVVLSEGKSLMALVAKSDDAFWISSALQKGGDANIEDTKGSGTPAATPLMHAIQAHKRENVEVLVKHGANMNHKDFYKASPLTLAAGANQFDITFVLLEAGADVSVPNQVGNSIAEYMKWKDVNRGIAPSQKEWFLKVKEFLEKHGHLEKRAD